MSTDPANRLPAALVDELSRVRTMLAHEDGIQQAIVFGSVARGTARTGSDLDIAVAADHVLAANAKVRLIEALAAATGRPIDLIDLATAGEPLLGEILRDGLRLAGTDAQFADLMTRHLLDAADFLPYVERMLRERRRAWTG